MLLFTKNPFQEIPKCDQLFLRTSVLHSSHTQPLSSHIFAKSYMWELTHIGVFRAGSGMGMVQFSVCKTAVCHLDHLELGKTNKQTNKKAQIFNTCSFMPLRLPDTQLVCIASLSAVTGKSHSNTKRVCVDKCIWCVKRLDRLNTVF